MLQYLLYKLNFWWKKHHLDMVLIITHQKLKYIDRYRIPSYNAHYNYYYEWWENKDTSKLIVVYKHAVESLSLVYLITDGSSWLEERLPRVWMRGIKSSCWEDFDENLIKLFSSNSSVIKQYQNKTILGIKLLSNEFSNIFFNLIY